MTEDFNRLVDGYVASLLDQGVADYCELILKLPGVYPSVALQSVDRLARHKRISTDLAQSLLDQSRQRRKHIGATYDYKVLLPLPHPLDFEWRFSDAASAYLIDRCEGLDGPIDNLIMLGTPSLLRYSNERRQPSYKTHFMGDHTSVTAGLESFCLANIERCNVFYDVSASVTGARVIIDPPWYDEFIRVFMWKAKQLCDIGGYLLISLPADGTRPGVAREWDDILSWAGELGFTLVSKEESVLPYSTPFFELNALRAEGINNVPHEWRRGNLVIFRNDQHRVVEKPEFGPGIRWSEATVGDVRFKVRSDDSCEFSDPYLRRIIDGDVLPTVSRKDERRAKATVWTSGNRIYDCKGPSTLMAILEAVENGQPTKQAVADRLKRNLTAKEADAVNAASQQIAEIVEIENREYDVYYKVSL